MTREAVHMVPLPALLHPGAVAAVAIRPKLWGTAIRLARRLQPDPGHSVEAFLRFRNQTQRGGDGSGPPNSQDLVQFLEWSRKWARVTKDALH